MNLLRRIFVHLRPALLLRPEWAIGDRDMRAARRVERTRSKKAHWRRRAAECQAARERFLGTFG